MHRSNGFLHQHSDLLRSSLLAAACVASAALCGCETPQPAQPQQDRSETARQKPEPAPASDRASELASIAERDVQAFLDRQRPSEATDSRQQRAEVRPTREIQWNLPAESPRPAQQSADARETTVQSSELFLLPDEGDPKPKQKQSEAPVEEDVVDLERDRIRELIIELSKHLYRESTYADMPLRELLLIAATSMLTPDRALDPQAIPALTERERELLSEFQQFFVQLGRDLDGNRTADDVLLHALDGLRASLSTEPKLFLETIALCTRVGGFGDYDPFSRYSFLAHAEQQAVLYLEVAGFSSELNQQRQWVTELSLQLMIYSDRDGIPVWREDWQTAVDVSRNKRQDFFMVQLLTLPRALSVGRYHMKVRVRDEKSGAEAEGSIAFEIVADPKLAVGGGR